MRQPGHFIVCCLALIVGFGSSQTAQCETELPQARFVYLASPNHHFFNTTGSITFELPPGISATTETIELRRTEIASGAVETTTAIYDPATSFTRVVYPSLCGTGPSVLSAILKQSHRRAWTSFSRSGNSPALMTDTTASTAQQYLALTLNRQNALFDADTTATWRGDDPLHDYHWSREDAYYAWALLQKNDTTSSLRANQILQTLATFRDTTTSPLTRGAFFTNSSDMQEPEQSCTFFITSLLAEMLLHPPAGLTTATIQQLSPAVHDAAYYLKTTFDNGYSLDHTNFAALAAAAMELSGKLHNDPILQAAARYYLDGFYDHIILNGASLECNSPVYGGVSLWALMLLQKETTDPTAAAQCRVLIDKLWLELALHYYAPIADQAGPYSRVYDDGLRGGTGLAGLLLNEVLNRPAYLSTGRLSENFFANHSLDIDPAAFLTSFTQPPQQEIAQVFLSRPLPARSYQRTLIRDFFTYLTPSFSLGSLDWAPTIQNEGFLLQVLDSQSPVGFVPVFARSGVTTNEVTTVGETMRLAQFGVQSDNRVIYFSDGLVPTGEPAASKALLALVADERFGQWQDLRANADPMVLPYLISGGECLFARRAGVFLAVQPVFSNPAGPRSRFGTVSRSDEHLNLSLFAVDTSSPINLVGTRIEAGWAIRCEESADWPSYNAFIADHLAHSQLTLQEDATSRTIRWNLGGELACVYDRAAHELLQSTQDGQPLRPGTMATSEFFVMLPPAGGTMTLRDLSISGLLGSGWIVYPVSSQTALLTNASRNSQTVSTSWTSSSLNLPAFTTVRLQRPIPSATHEWRNY